MRLLLKLFCHSRVFLFLFLIIYISLLPNLILGSENEDCISGNCDRGYGKTLYGTGTIAKEIEPQKSFSNKIPIDPSGKVATLLYALVHG